MTNYISQPAIKNRFSRALKAYGVSVGNDGMNMLVIFIITPVILSLISSNSYGFWMTILQMVGLLGIMDMGVTIAITRKIADPEIAGDENRLSRLISSGVLIQLGLASLILIAGFVFADNMLALFDIDTKQEPTGKIAYIVMIVWFTLSLPLGVIDAMLNGRQEMTLVNLVTGISRVAGTVLIVPLLYTGLDLMAFPVSLIVPGVTGALVLFYYLKRLVPHFKLGISNVSWDEIKRLSSFSALWWMSKLGYLVLYSSDNIILASTVGVDLVTVYYLNNRLPFMLGMLSSKIANAAMPGISELYATKNYDGLQRAASSLLFFSTRIAIFFMAITMCLNSRLIPIWVGAEYYNGIGLTILLSLICLSNTMIGGIGSLVISSGKIKAFGWIFFTEGILKVALSLLLIPYFGIVGLALGHIIAVGVFSLLFFPVQISKLVNMNFKELFATSMLKPILYSIPCLIMLILLLMIVPVSWGWPGIFLIGTGGLLVNIGIFDFMKLKNSTGQNWLYRLKLIITP